MKNIIKLSFSVFVIFTLFFGFNIESSKAQTLDQGSKIIVLKPGSLNETYLSNNVINIVWDSSEDANTFSIDLIDSDTSRVIKSIATSTYFRSSGIDGLFRYDWKVPSGFERIKG